MNNKKKYFFAFVCIPLLLCSCGKQNMLTVNIPSELDAVIEIKRWLAIGPFEYDSLQMNIFDSFYTEDLKQFGIEEGSINGEGIEKMQQQGVGVSIIDQRSVKVRLFDYIGDNKDNLSNYYLITKINASKTQDVALIIDGSHTYAGWLNGEKLLEIDKQYSTIKVGDRFIKVSLRKGENTLFFKVNKGTNKESWDLCCAIAPLREAERIFRANYTSDFVTQPIVNDSVAIYAGTYKNGKVEITDLNNQTVAVGLFNNQDTNENPFLVSGLHTLQDGFYKTILTLDGERMEQTIYKGDYDEFLAQATNDIEKITENSLNLDEMKSTVYLINFLKNRSWNPESPSSSRYYRRNFVFWGYSLYRMLHHASSPTQLMVYKNENGDSREFIFHVGNGQMQNIPLIIVMPYEMITESLLEDWYISNVDLIEGDHALADEYGFAIAFIYVEGKHYTVEKAEKEITAVIDRITSKYDIDRDHIFIFGECVGGRRALAQLSRSSQKYAACAVSSPITLVGDIDEIPINLIPLMGNTPIMIQHGINDEVVPVEHSRRFVAESKKYNLSIAYTENDDSHVYVDKSYRRFAFEFFREIAKKQD